MRARVHLRIILAVFTFCLLPTIAFSQDNWAGDLRVKDVSGSGFIYFGTNQQPDHTCNHWGRFFRFDARTPEGQIMLSILLTAHASNRPIDVWYSSSPVAGSDHNSGCNGANVSTLNNIGIP